MNEKRIDKARKFLQSYRVGKYKVLGEGFSSVVFCNSSFVYKVYLLHDIASLDYQKDLLLSLKNKLHLFSNSQYFYQVLEFEQVNEFCFILVYEYEKSASCTYFEEDELADFLAECWQKKLIFLDIKVENFIRVNQQLKWIDYEPQNRYTDNYFLNMVARAFLMLRYNFSKEKSDLKKLYRSAINQFDLPELGGLQNFCNRVFSFIVYRESLDQIRDFRNNSKEKISQSKKSETANIHKKSGLLTIEKKEKENFNELFFSMLARNRYIKNIIPINIQLNCKNYFSPQKYLLDIVEITPTKRSVSLIIKACIQDAEIIYQSTIHIVRQLSMPNEFCEKIIAIDKRAGSFLREYNAENSLSDLKQEIDKLIENKIIDKVIEMPQNEVEKINRDWFNLDSLHTHTATKIPVAPQLYAFECARGDFVLQMDCDVMICRKDHDHSFLEDMIEVIDSNKNVVSVGFNIFQSIDNKEYYGFEDGGFVPEVRMGLFHKDRLLNLRPFPNKSLKDGLELSWYRSMHEKQKQTGISSVRGGSSKSFYVHPQNYRKKDKDTWFTIVDRVEQNCIPNEQQNQFDLKGSYYDWCQPKRNESVVIVSCLHNISIERFLRYWYSLISQNYKDWGLILIDDHSSNGIRFLISHLIEPYLDKITFISNRFRMGVASNTYKAIHYFTENPQSIITIVDADDALLGKDCLQNIVDKYIHYNADVTVGKMYRTDKLNAYYKYPANFIHPRKYGGNVWQHLRTFKKYLFDSLRLSDLKIPSGNRNRSKDILLANRFSKKNKWPQHCWDYTYMIPIVEMAKNPMQVHSFNYYHERTTPATSELRKTKDHIIQQILSKKSKNANDITIGRRQFLPNLQKVELDITYECNLKCFQCNRSCTQAPTTESMTVEQIEKFISESVELQKKWELINILGGEPTLHPDFHKIVNTILSSYIDSYSYSTILQVTSNGYGEQVQQILSLLPQHKNLVIDTASFKDDRKVLYFSPFNQAPVDDPKMDDEYHKGCWVTSYCGIGLNHMGYYPCGVAGGIDRVIKQNLGLQSLKEVDESIQDTLNDFCRYCGNFSDYAVNKGDFIPRHEKDALTNNTVSKTWKKLYKNRK